MVQLPQRSNYAVRLVGVISGFGGCRKAKPPNSVPVDIDDSKDDLAPPPLPMLPSVHNSTRLCENSLGVALTRAWASNFEAYDRSKFNSTQKSAF